MSQVSAPFDPPSASWDRAAPHVLRVLMPPVNLAKVSTPWKSRVGGAREVMAAEARVWARERGFDC